MITKRKIVSALRKRRVMESKLKELERRVRFLERGQIKIERRLERCLRRVSLRKSSKR